MWDIWIEDILELKDGAKAPSSLKLKFGEKKIGRLRVHSPIDFTWVKFHKILLNLIKKTPGLVKFIPLYSWDYGTTIEFEPNKNPPFKVKWDGERLGLSYGSLLSNARILQGLELDKIFSNRDLKGIGKKLYFMNISVVDVTYEPLSEGEFFVNVYPTKTGRPSAVLVLNREMLELTSLPEFHYLTTKTGNLILALSCLLEEKPDLMEKTPKEVLVKLI